MDIRRTRIAILLAGTFVAICLPSGALATPSETSSQAVWPAPQGSGPSVADIEAALQSHKEIEEKLQSRIRDLEEAQKKLLDHVKTAEALANDPPQRPAPQPSSVASLNWILSGVAAFTFALSIILLLRLRRSEIATQSRVWEEPVSLGVSPPPSELTAPASVMETEPLPTQSSDDDILSDWGTVSPALDSQPPKVLAVKENIRSHDTTIELAEIMLSFGRINSAAEALSNFIENNPKEAFAPWLKLLEVYRANGQCAEFSKIAQKLNKTFNVWTVDWDNFNEALTPANGLETAPHIMDRLQELWGTRKCQAYLQSLLCDTRNETRRGFPLAAIDDILCLNDILEHALGPYTGPTNLPFSNGSLDTAPLTETEKDIPICLVLAGEENNAELDVGELQMGEDIQDERYS